jgi:hypothetical protein
MSTGPEVPASLVPHPTTQARDRAIERLSAAFAEGALDTDEFERRVTVAHRTSSTQEIATILADLPDATVALVPATSPTAMASATRAPACARALSVFGSTRRAGQWVVPSKLEVKAVFGNVELDFRSAVLPDGVVDLDVSAVFGNIEIVVPPHLAVEADGNAILGNFDHVDRAPRELAPDAPVLRIRGRCVFGNVEVGMRLVDDPDPDRS